MSTGNQQYLQRYNKPILSTALSDNNSPYSFKNWYNAHQLILPGQEYALYNAYLVDWLKNKSAETTDTRKITQLNYLTLLKQLQLFFSQTEIENWYNNIDINNEKELLLAIPYFAKKLKEISLYYLQLRRTIKETRLNYNQAGTNKGTALQIQNYLLNTYTQKPNSLITLPATIWNGVPALSAIKDYINIQIEELYDSSNYFDQSPVLPVSAYYDTSDPVLQKFLTTKGLALTSTDWIYKLGTYSLSANPLILTPILCADPFFQETLYNNILTLNDQLAQNYIGQDKYISPLSTTLSSQQQDFYNIQIQQGTNTFYWPNAAYAEKAISYPRYLPTLLSDMGIETLATGGSSVDTADTIFVKTSKGIEGAWLCNNLYNYIPSTMEATLKGNNSKTVFRYPYPGYGLSSEDIMWTGPDVVSTFQFNYLDPDLKQLVLDAYWSASITLTSTTNTLKINDTTLIDNKAFPSVNYNNADQIKTQTSFPAYNTTNQFPDNTTGAWLYQFLKTDISIANGKDSVIVWPFESIDPNMDIPTYYPTDLTNYCSTINVNSSAFLIPNAIAGNALSSADIIYKVTNPNDTKDLAIECCWLSGAQMNTTPNGGAFSVNTVNQTTLQCLISSGYYARFVWTGPDDTDVNDVIPTFNHQPDCKYVTTPNTTYLDYDLCTCKQVLFNSFGHPGSNYTDNSALGDFIIQDTFSPGTLDLTTWTDLILRPYYSSENFFWYSTNNEIGWGDGRWYSTTGDFSAKLKHGVPYVYYRASARLNNKNEVTLPAIIIRSVVPTVYSTNEIKSLTGVTVTSFTSGNGYTSAPTVTVNTNNASVITPLVATALMHSNGAGVTGVNVTTPGLYILNANEPTITFTGGGYTTQATGTAILSSAGNYISTPPSPVWVQAKKDKNNNWVSTQETSQMSLHPGDILIYSRSNTTSYNLYSYTNVYKDVSLNKGSLWCDFDYMSTGINSLGQAKFITLNYPTQLYTTPTDDLYPFPYTSLSAIIGWTITNTTNNDSVTYLTNAGISFTPNDVEPGNMDIYTVTVTALELNGTYSDLSAFRIPDLTAISSFVSLPSLTSFSAPVPGFVLNTPLQGWNYNTATYQQSYDTNVSNIGARPFWGKIYTQDNSNYKGIDSWGTPQRILDGHNIITQPEISDIQLASNTYIEYTNKNNTPLNWVQPIELAVHDNSNTWYTLNYTTTSFSNLSSQINNIDTEVVVVTPTTDVSNLSIQNYIDNNPVQIVYYANNSFNWAITATPVDANILAYDNNLSAVRAINSLAPWTNLSNQVYPSVAAFPSFENLYSAEDSGVYFTPSNLGVSVFTNKDYTTSTSTSSFALTAFFEDKTKTVGIRGFSKTDQPTPYNVILNNNIWLKENTLSSPIAGNIKKDVYKKYQKFVPYQSTYETTPNNNIGLLLPNSRQTPWGGYQDLQWVDAGNAPKSFTGTYNVSAWAGSQILKQNNLQLDNWVTDIFGNQYGLYKNIKNVSPANRKKTTGEIWTRNSIQNVSPASKSLSGVFNTYTGTSLINDLTGNSINKIDTFFDVLYVETSKYAILDKLNYDFNTGIISSNNNLSRGLSLAIPVTASLIREFKGQDLNDHTFAKIGDTWFFPNRNIVILSVCGLTQGLSGINLTPELYQYDINTYNIKKIFPLIQNDIDTFTSLSGLNIKTIETPALTYNPLTSKYTFAVFGKGKTNDTLVEIVIKDLVTLTIDTLTVYTSNDTPLIVDPPYIPQSLTLTLSASGKHSYTIVPNTSANGYGSDLLPPWVTLIPLTLGGGTYACLFNITTPSLTGTYYAPFSVQNRIGSAYYTLTINVTSN